MPSRNQGEPRIRTASCRPAWSWRPEALSEGREGAICIPSVTHDIGTGSKIHHLGDDQIHDVAGICWNSPAWRDKVQAAQGSGRSFNRLSVETCPSGLVALRLRRQAPVAHARAPPHPAGRVNASAEAMPAIRASAMRTGPTCCKLPKTRCRWEGSWNPRGRGAAAQPHLWPVAQWSDLAPSAPRGRELGGHGGGRDLKTVLAGQILWRAVWGPAPGGLVGSTHALGSVFNHNCLSKISPS